MTERRRHWGWAVFVSTAALAGMFLISLLGVPKLPSVMAIMERDLPDVSLHTIPRYVHATASTRKLPTAIWLVRSETEWRALSNQSTHWRACEVQWMPGEQRFIDPCLGTVYDRTGLNIAGPAPTGLDSYPVTIMGMAGLEVDLSQPRPVTPASRR